MKPLLLAVCIAAVAVSSCGGGNKGSGGGGGGGGTGPGTTPTPVPTPAPTPAPTPVPTVTSIAPTSGMAAGGTQVTIAGTNFASGATVTIGTVALTSVSVTATAITGTTGASSTAGPANVTVSNPGGGGSATLQNGFTYQSLPRAVISGGLSVVQHNTNVTLSGAMSSTTSPYSINRYTWNCGQDASAYGTGCEVANNPTPTFNYRRCGVSGRPACTSGNQRAYTVTLTVADTQGNTNSTTFSITVTNQY